MAQRKHLYLSNSGSQSKQSQNSVSGIPNLRNNVVEHTSGTTATQPRGKESLSSGSCGKAARDQEINPI